MTEARQRIQARGAERRDHDGGAGDSQQKQGHLPDGRRVVGFNAEQQRLEPWQCAGGERQGRADEGFGEQHTWLAVWQALPRFRDDCSERTFVFRIAHNRAVSHIQHWQRRRTDPLEDDAPIAASGDDPERSLSQQQRRERLQAAVQELPLGLRQVVVLTLEGLSNAEVADIVGISENNVAVRMTRARAELTRLLGAGRKTT